MEADDHGGSEAATENASASERRPVSTFKLDLWWKMQL